MTTFFTNGTFAMQKCFCLGGRTTTPTLAHVPDGPLELIILFSLGPCMTDEFPQEINGYPETAQRLWESLDELDPLECEGEGADECYIVSQISEKLERIDVRSRLKKLRQVCRNFYHLITNEENPEAPHISRLYNYVTENKIFFMGYNSLRVFCMLLDKRPQEIQELLGESESLELTEIQDAITTRLPFLPDAYTRFSERCDTLKNPSLQSKNWICRNYRKSLPLHFVCGCFVASHILGPLEDSYEQIIINLLKNNNLFLAIFGRIMDWSKEDFVTRRHTIEYILLLPGIEDVFFLQVDPENRKKYIAKLGDIAYKAVNTGSRKLLQLALKLNETLHEQRDFFDDIDPLPLLKKMLFRGQVELIEDIFFHLYEEHEPSQTELFIQHLTELQQWFRETDVVPIPGGPRYMEDILILIQRWIDAYQQYHEEPDFRVRLLEHALRWLDELDEREEKEMLQKKKRCLVM